MIGQSIMSQPSKKKKDLNAGAQPLVHAAFAGLDIPDLPPGKPEPVVDDASPQSRWKMGRVVLQKETAHRGGKTVIVIKDFASHLPQSVIETVAKRVRSACGCGGTVKDKRIEIQGDQVAKIRAVLESEGFTVAGLK